MKKLIKLLFSRVVIVCTLIIVQALFIILLLWGLSSYFIYIYSLLGVLSFVVVLFIVSKSTNPSYKLAWVIPILIFPVFGGLLYLLIGSKSGTKSFKERIEDSYNKTIPLLKQDKDTLNKIETQDENIALQCKYITKASLFPVCENTTSNYFASGEKLFEKLMDEIQKAEHYIFMEYFIINEGFLWDDILDILKEKVKQGVDVRVMYDDIGCIRELPYKYNEKLKQMGIRCSVFNPFRPVLDRRLNNRDHRKITIIDGHTAFTGGANIADEYINKVQRFGHWKDSGIMIKGEAVWNITVLFLGLWDYVTEEKDRFENYLPYMYYSEKFKSDGFVQPYGDSPFDSESTGEFTYLNMINRARKYVYITTPYLVIDNEMVTALTLAAKSGIDVRIITPYIGDKWYVHLVTKSYYKQLIEVGVKIYEYTPGFIHSKNFICDDEVGIVGSINLDYRSLCSQFECGVLLYKARSVTEIKKDFTETFNMSHEITVEECNNVKWYIKLLSILLRIVAPLM